MCLLNFVLFFKIHYKCEFGYSVYVVGNVEALGNWNSAKALRLTWSEGHFWSEKLRLIHENTKMIEYKYFIAPTNLNLNSNTIRWEEGPNRMLNLGSASKLVIKLNDDWEQIKIKICLHAEALNNDNNSNFTIAFNSSLTEVAMTDLKSRKYSIKGRGKCESFYIIPIKISNKTEFFSYQYQLIDNKTGDIINDRFMRKISFKKFPFYSNNNECYMIKGATMMKFDFTFQISTQMSMITPEIYVGSFTQTTKDVDYLIEKGITSVLNLQTKEDMERFSVDWDSLNQYYLDNNISVVHFPIIDMDAKDLKAKCKNASQIVHELLQSNEKIFIHCTAGRNRSTHVAIDYLWSYKRIKLKEAIDLMQSHRGKFRVVEEVFQRH